MRRVRSKDTAPEIAVRRLLRSIGLTGYRLHRKDLPGTPDIAFIGRRKAVFVHGCFWHGHQCARGARIPATNRSYWIEKINRNRARDAERCSLLSAIGWKSLVIWECELGDSLLLADRLSGFILGD